MTFWSDMTSIFSVIETLFKFKLNFPEPIGPISALEIFCSLSIMYMLADIAEGYFGWTGNDGDNR